MRDQHVYVIDDDDAVRNAIVRSLERLGYDVHPFAGASSFLEGLNIRRPAVVLADMQMPGVNGLELQACLATTGWDVPIIFISGESTLTQSATALEQGAFSLLSKPFGLDELARAVAAAMEKDALKLQIGSGRDGCL